MHKRLHLVLFLTVLLAIPGLSMDFSWAEGPKVYGRLEMSGEIKIGDYQRFLSFVRDHIAEYRKTRQIYLSSPGGNLVESLKMAGLLRQMYPVIHVKNAQCASSCFFLYLSGAERYAVYGSLGIHRAYFDRTYFAGLDANEARVQQTKLTSLVTAILEDNGVLQEIREKMSSTASDEIYWLSREQIFSLGVYPSWYEELLIAKCEDYTKLRRSGVLDPVDFDAIAGFYLCEQEILAPEMKKLPALLDLEKTKLTEALVPTVKKNPKKRLNPRNKQ